MDLFENDVFLLLCGQVETELFENTAISDLWGSRQGILFICFRISNITAFRVDGHDFENASRVDADIFNMDIKRRVFKNIRIRLDGA